MMDAIESDVGLTTTMEIITTQTSNSDQDTSVVVTADDTAVSESVSVSLPVSEFESSPVPMESLLAVPLRQETSENVEVIIASPYAIPTPPPLPIITRSSTNVVTTFSVPYSGDLEAPLLMEETCTICCDAPASVHLPCGSQFCKQCLGTHWKNSIESRFGSDPIFRCPACHAPQTDDVVLPCLEEQVSLKLTSIRLQKALRSDKSFHPCPGNNCTYIGFASRQCADLECNSCGHTWEDRTFSLSRVLGRLVSCFDLRNALWKVFFTKSCPKCRSSIQKNGGCPHMTCLKCHHQFCWKCGSAWPHKGSCKAWIKTLLCVLIFVGGSIASLISCSIVYPSVGEVVVSILRWISIILVAIGFVIISVFLNKRAGQCYQQKTASACCKRWACHIFIEGSLAGIGYGLWQSDYGKWVTILAVGIGGTILVLLWCLLVRMDIRHINDQYAVKPIYGMGQYIPETMLGKLIQRIMFKHKGDPLVLRQQQLSKRTTPTVEV
eukprot:GILJ01000356.1.p1 GENE.GILJ01000356.1~~GILJ01000356.1.p1  ORF type:complete len:494 (-),score=11.71 GILJ01000356.1:186-1667(-)